MVLWLAADDWRMHGAKPDCRRRLVPAIAPGWERQGLPLAASPLSSRSRCAACIRSSAGASASPRIIRQTEAIEARRGGMAHIASGIGADAEFRSPMALVVIGGLITSTLLSLVVVPAIYTVVDDLGLRAARLWRRQPGEAAEPVFIGRI